MHVFAWKCSTGHDQFIQINLCGFLSQYIILQGCNRTEYIFGPAQTIFPKIIKCTKNAYLATTIHCSIQLDIHPSVRLMLITKIQSNQCGSTHWGVCGTVVARQLDNGMNDCVRPDRYVYGIYRNPFQNGDVSVS